MVKCLDIVLIGLSRTRGTRTSVVVTSTVNSSRRPSYTVHCKCAYGFFTSSSNTRQTITMDGNTRDSAHTCTRVLWNVLDVQDRTRRAKDVYASGVVIIILTVVLGSSTRTAFFGGRAIWCHVYRVYRDRFTIVRAKTAVDGRAAADARKWNTENAPGTVPAKDLSPVAFSVLFIIIIAISIVALSRDAPLDYPVFGTYRSRVRRRVRVAIHRAIVVRTPGRSLAKTLASHHSVCTRHDHYARLPDMIAS